MIYWLWLETRKYLVSISQYNVTDRKIINLITRPQSEELTVTVFISHSACSLYLCIVNEEDSFDKSRENAGQNINAEDR